MSEERAGYNIVTPEQQEEDLKWMARALELAANAEALDEVPVGAVVVKNGEVIGEGFNQPISSHDPTAHAEILALRSASRTEGNYRLTGSTIYSTIEPCSMCAGALVHARVKRLVYGAKEPRAGAVESRVKLLDNGSLNHRVAVTAGVLENACSETMRSYFKSKR